MNETPRRRWYQLSLRSLMIVVTLVCVVLGGVMCRVDYLRRWAMFHERRLEEELAIPGRGYQDSFPGWYHRVMSQRFRAAMWYPWTTVYDDLSVKEVREYLESPDSFAPSPNTPEK